LVKIAPSILSAAFAALGEQVRKVETAGAELLHIDVMDGHFVPNITIGPLVVEALRPVSKMILDVHLMIENPDFYIMQFARAGADIVTVHVETCPHLHRTVQVIKDAGIKAGVALNPSTPPDVLEYVLEQLDLVLIMTVNPGFGGQKFIREMLPKISKVKAMLDQIHSTALLQVDGGVNVSTAREVAAAGADTLVAGSAVFGAEDPAVAVQKIKAAAAG